MIVITNIFFYSVSLFKLISKLLIWEALFQLPPSSKMVEGQKSVTITTTTITSPIRNATWHRQRQHVQVTNHAPMATTHHRHKLGHRDLSSPSQVYIFFQTFWWANLFQVELIHLEDSKRTVKIRPHQ